MILPNPKPCASGFLWKALPTEMDNLPNISWRTYPFEVYYNY